ncbi:Bud-site selection protein [Lipomyces kononenkoae]|uniref:Bud-site selection protein n=1 Tax=Lipomyces kononenkoae TaxID=34357 RepID=A0ACC3STN9_LIPKO
MAAVSSSHPQSKRKRENVLWELDLLESKLTSGSKKPRLVRTKLAIDRINKKIKKGQQQNAKEESKDTEIEKTEENTEALSKRALELKRKLVEQRIYHWNKELGRSLKKAKPFEIQRIVRKLKDSRTSNQADDILKHEQELVAIKTLDTNAIAHGHLWKRLRRNRFLYASQLLPGSSPKVEIDTSENGKQRQDAEDAAAIKQDITARLFKNKTVQTTVAEAIDSIVTAVGLAHNSLDKKKDKKNQQRQPNEDEESAVEEDGLEQSDTDDDDEQGSDDAGGATDDDEGLDDEERKSSPVIDPSGGLRVTRLNTSEDTRHVRDADDVSISELSDEHPEGEYESEEELENDARLESAAAKAASNLPQKNVGKTTDAKLARSVVLPSLNVGYISPSASDDEFYDEERIATGSSSSVQRKNRRGQRARQKIWEQKYGKNAAHLKKKEHERAEKAEKKKRRSQERRAQREQQAIDESVDSTLKKAEQKVVENKPLHPSWEARQQKSKNVDFKGKKIVFE